MARIIVEILPSLQMDIAHADGKLKKLFEKQKKFMTDYPNYPSLGKKKLEGVRDKYGDQLWEIRLNIRDRIVFVERDSGQRVIWLKVVDHDELIRKNTIHAKGDYRHTT